jgi:hypothetical protein
MTQAAAIEHRRILVIKANKKRYEYSIKTPDNGE